MRSNVSAALAVVLCVSTAHAGLEIVTPFVGDYSEDYEEFSLGQQIGGLPLFDGHGTMAGGFTTAGSSFMGSTISPHTGALFAHWTAPIEFEFFTPVTEFGAYMATNGGANGGLVEFFDAQDVLIDSVPLDVTFQKGSAPYTWNGWASATPIHRILITGNGVLEGFLGVDNAQIRVVVPAPATLAVLALAAWRRRRRNS